MGRNAEFGLGHYNSAGVVVNTSPNLTKPPKKSFNTQQREQAGRKASDAATLEAQSRRVRAESDAEYKKRRGGRPSFL